MAVSFDPTAVATNLLPHFGNDVLRFGQHNTHTVSRGSLNGASGALFGPEYYDDIQEQWFRGTYNYHDTTLAIGVGGTEADPWNLEGSPLDNNSYFDKRNNNLDGFINENNQSTLFPALSEGTNFTFDDSGLNGTFGSFTWTGFYTLDNDDSDVDIKLTRTYTLGENDSFFKEETTIENIDEDGDQLTNLRLWIGVADDYVGLSDSNDKVKGNFISDIFVPVSSSDGDYFLNDNQDVQSTAILVGSKYPGVGDPFDADIPDEAFQYFYTDSPNGYAIIGERLGFDFDSEARNSVTFLDPLGSDTTIDEDDGSYAIYFKLDNLSEGSSASVNTYWGLTRLSNIETAVMKKGFSQFPLSFRGTEEEEPNEITGSSSDDLLQGAGSLDVMKGGSGNDYLKAKDNNDILIGGSGNDSLYGGKDNDELIGGSGSDILGGGKGDDILVGGSNADTFKISKGNDLIRDFSIDQNDRIDANGYNLEFMQDGINLLISDSENDVLTTVLNLNRDDFLAWQPELMG